MDLAQKPELIEAMVKANFFFVFIGIESPSKESLTEAKKFQKSAARSAGEYSLHPKQGPMGMWRFYPRLRFRYRGHLRTAEELYRTCGHPLGDGRILAGASDDPAL